MSDPILICEDNVSIAWAKAIQKVKASQSHPLCVSIINFEDGNIKEELDIRSSLDALLKAKGIVSVRETSETIFPYLHWSKKTPSAAELTAWYRDKYLPRHRARVRLSAKRVTKETYFERLVAYQGYELNNGQMQPKLIDQLGRILDTFRHYKQLGRNPSPSKFIATCLNPSTDNTNRSPYLPFPCLQQVGFCFAGGNVEVTGFYTIQYLMKRGYGNYLGLCYLGQFIAKETGLPLARVNCFVGNPRIDNFTQADLVPMLSAIPAE